MGPPAAPSPPEQRCRIAVVTADVLAVKMAGPAIRAWHIAQALAAEHAVELVSTSARPCQVSSPHFTARSVRREDLQRVEAGADVVVVQGYLLVDHPFLLSTSKVLVVDLYDPLHLEELELYREASEDVRRHTVAHATEVLNDQLRRGDFFMCASTKQRDFWLGQMSALGRLNHANYDEDPTFHSLIAVVPFGIEDRPPEHTRAALKAVVPGINEGDEVVLWGGGIYNWFDPLTLVRAVELLRRRRPQVRLFFMGGRHPNPDVPEMRVAAEARRLADELGLTGVHVFFNDGWVDYDDRQNYLLEADVGVSTHLSHLETVFSFRTRILDYIWAGLPIVATEGDAFAELIDDAQLGFTVPVGDVDALESALYRALDDGASAAQIRHNLGVVRPGLRWSVGLEPLMRFCRSPRRAPDLVDPVLAMSLGHGSGGLQKAVRALRRARRSLVALRRGQLPRLVRRAGSGLQRRLAGPARRTQ